MKRQSPWPSMKDRAAKRRAKKAMADANKKRSPKKRLARKRRLFHQRVLTERAASAKRGCGARLRPLRLRAGDGCPMHLQAWHANNNQPRVDTPWAKRGAQ